jgi:hypothetical protein
MQWVHCHSVIVSNLKDWSFSVDCISQVLNEQVIGSQRNNSTCLSRKRFPLTADAWFLDCTEKSTFQYQWCHTWWDFSNFENCEEENMFKGNKHSCPLHACFLLGLFFNPEDGGDMLLRNGGRLSTGYIVLYPRRYYRTFHIHHRKKLRSYKFINHVLRLLSDM